MQGEVRKTGAKEGKDRGAVTLTKNHLQKEKAHLSVKISETVVVDPIPNYKKAFNSTGNQRGSHAQTSVLGQ